MSMTKDPNWHLDKRVSIFTLVALTVQFVGLVIGGTWFVGEFKAGMEANAKGIAVNAASIIAHEREIAEMRARDSEQAVQLGRIEENVSSIKASVDRLVRIQDERSGP